MILTPVALPNRELAPEHELLENPIPALKKEPWNGYPRQKNLSNTSGARPMCRRRNTIGKADQNGNSVTTSHVFRPNKPRKAFSVLPIWLRNSGFSRRSSRHKPRGGAGGGQPHTAGKMPRSHKLARNFILKAFPPLSLFVQKMRRAVAPQLAS